MSTAHRGCTRCRPITASSARSGSHAALHVLSVIAMASVGLMLSLGPIYAIGVVAVAALLAYEQQLVSPTDLSRVNMAFLSVNGVIALLYLGTVALDVAVS